ncbi:MAG: glycosyltransferase, partial [Rhizobiaceae bacterium]|nr:glycosyltransferase [Rhizobiaceae bacterium]
MDLLEAFEQVMRLDERGEVDAAVAGLNELYDRIPETVPYLKFAGQLYQRLGADRPSLTLLQRALALAPDDPEILLSLGYHYVDNGRPDLALDFFQRHLALNPDSADGQIYLGRTLDWLGRLEEAEAALAQAIALFPSELETLLFLGRVRLRRGRFAEAKQAFAAAEIGSPDNVLAEIGLRRADALANPRPRAASFTSANTVVCVKAGTKYGPDYANRLASMVRRHTTRDMRVVCFTDDPTGLNDDVEAQPLPVAGLTGWWNKVALFGESLPGVSGRVLYLDLDVVITGPLDPLLDCPGSFVIMDNDYVPGFNSSVMLFDVGAQPHVWSRFSREPTEHIQGDQDWM